jgi:hypothetical protein
MSKAVLDDVAGRWTADLLAEPAPSERYWIFLACAVLANLFIAVRLVLG